MEAQQIFVEMALKAWDTQLSRAGKLFNEFSDEDLNKEVSPGRNRVIYLLGHLIAANDNMMSLLGLGERLFADYDEAFLKSADKTGHEFPTADALRAAWTASGDALNKGFAALTPVEWMGRHTAVNDEDFAKEPTRNKLNVLISRTNHLAYHMGQVTLAKSK